MRRIHENVPQSTLDSKNEYRSRIEVLRSRIGLLTGQDRLLMTMYLENGNSFRQMAKLAGINEVNIARRIRKVTKRLINGEYITCLRNRDKFTSREMGIAKDYFLMGASIKKISVKRRLSYYCIRETIKRIQQLITTLDNTTISPNQADKSIGDIA